jgi:CDP-diglyceride synthetase
MKAHTASLINALILIGFGLWAYLGSETPSKTALIPVIFGGVILALYPGVKNENKIVAHVAVLLTLLILGGLVKPLTAALDREDGLAIMRVLVMMVSTIVALVFFIKSFIDVRRARAKAAQES